MANNKRKRYTIDYDKVHTIEDIKRILKEIDLEITNIETSPLKDIAKVRSDSE